MASVIFIFEGVELSVQCLIEDKMELICKNYASKINMDINSLYFLYGGNQIDFKLKYKEQVNAIDKQRNVMNILVYKKEDENRIKCPNLIYCSSCKNIPEIKIENKGKEILFSKVCKCKPESEKSINDLIKIIFNQKENKKICQKDLSHGIAEEFCTNCLNWFCQKCSKEHNSLSNHITIKSNGNFEITSF